MRTVNILFIVLYGFKRLSVNNRCRTNIIKSNFFYCLFFLVRGLLLNILFQLQLNVEYALSDNPALYVVYFYQVAVPEPVH